MRPRARESTGGRGRSGDRPWRGILALLAVAMLGAQACDDNSGSSPGASVSVPPTLTSTLAPESSSTSSTSSTTISAPTTTAAVGPFMPVPRRELAFSLPPRFVAEGVDVPVVVTAEDEPVAVTVAASDGVVVAELDFVASGFWLGTVPGSLVAGSELRLHPVARFADGTERAGDEITVPLLATNGQQLELRSVEATVEEVYDREAGVAEGDLGWIPVPTGREGVPLTPVAIAAVSATEVAVLDPTTTRVTCFDLTGASTCTIPLPAMATGDLVTLGDGTLLISGIFSRSGAQELTVMRVDPRRETVEVVYNEYPLEVEGYPAVATNTQFTWDQASRTAWVGVPERDTTNIAPHDPNSFPFADGLHLDVPVTRGPTLTRSALRFDLSVENEASLLDGWSWVRLLDDTTGLGVGSTGLQVTDSGVVWFELEWVDYSTSEVKHFVVRWQPGQRYAETFEFDRFYLEGESRVLAVLDDDTVAVLDSNPRVTGARVRVIRFPAATGN